MRGLESFSFSTNRTCFADAVRYVTNVEADEATSVHCLKKASCFKQIERDGYPNVTRFAEVFGYLELQPTGLDQI